MAPQVRRYRQQRAGQWPAAPVMGRKLARDAKGFWDEHPAVTIAMERWVSRRHCHGCPFCDQYQRVARIRVMYGRRRR